MPLEDLEGVGVPFLLCKFCILPNCKAFFKMRLNKGTGLVEYFTNIYVYTVFNFFYIFVSDALERCS